MRESAELRDLTNQYVKARSRGDFSFVARHLSQKDGVLFVGTDPNEWWVGNATITEIMKAQTKELGGKLSVVPGKPQAYSEGTIGWVADRLVLKMPNGTRIPLRLTAVFRKEENDWKIILSHLSIGVRSEDVFGKKLTTK